MAKFLVIQTAFIGDVVLATAVIEKLRGLPGASVDFLVRKGNEALFSGHPYINKLYVWNKKKSKYLHLWQIAKQVRAEKYDYVINLHRFAASGFVTWYSGAKEKRGFDKNPFAFCYSNSYPHNISAREDMHPIHETDRNQKLIADIADNKPARPVLYPTVADKEKVHQYQSGPYICIAPSSVWFSKRMPESKWVELINRLPSGNKIYLIAGPEDAELCERIKIAATHPAIVNLAGKLSFLQSGALMKEAVMNYSNDSAPIHFASAVNAPVTAVFCSTSPCYGFGPLSDTKKIVEVAGLDCKPCSLHGLKDCPKGHFKCGNDISIDQLLWWTSKTI